MYALAFTQSQAGLSDLPTDAGALFREHADRVTRWARRLGGPQLDCEDVVQEVFFTAHRLLPKFGGEGRVVAWLYRITENAVRHQRRKERFRRFLGGSADDVAGNVRAKGNLPDEDLERTRSSTLVHRVLSQMKEKYRTVLVLYEMEGSTGEEIADALGSSPDTVWVWLHRARAQFAILLKKEMEKPNGGL